MFVHVQEIGRNNMEEHKLATPFSILHAASLLSHKTRLKAFADALRKTVKETDIVYDIGTGTGILAIISAKAGAARVVALDIDPINIVYAQEAAKINGVAEKIHFVNAHYEDVKPEIKADIVVSEMLSSAMIIEQQITMANHVNKYILKEGGKIIPKRARVYFSLYNSKGILERFNFENLQFPLLPQSVEEWKGEELSEMVLFKDFDFTKQIDIPVSGTIKIQADRRGIAEGLFGVFEADVWNNIKIDYKDGWKPLFIPFEKPIKVEKGSIIEVSLSYIPADLQSLKIEAKKVS